MTRVGRMIADKIRANPFNPFHPRSKAFYNNIFNRKTGRYEDFSFNNSLRRRVNILFRFWVAPWNDTLVEICHWCEVKPKQLAPQLAGKWSFQRKSVQLLFFLPDYSGFIL